MRSVSTYHWKQRAVRYLFYVFLCMPCLTRAQGADFNFATGSVNGRNYVGGLTGRVSGPGEGLKNSYARGSVSGISHVGGLAGVNNGKIGFCYATGKVTGSRQTGGLAGSGTGTVVYSYWDIQTTNQGTSSGGAGRNSDPMTWPYASDTYAGWDFVSTWKSDVSPAQNNGYPVLASTDVFLVTVQVFPPGAGTVSGEGYYLSNQEAPLMAVADTAFVFKGWAWNNNLLSTQSQYAMKVTSSRSVVAKFESKTTPAEEDLHLPALRMKLYPNPANRIVWIDFSAAIPSLKSVCLVNMAGQTLKKIPAQNQSHGRLYFEVSDLLPGIYLVVALHEKGFISEKFVKH